MTQGGSESWVLGRLETLKRDLRRYERAYVTNFKRWGIGINQLMLLGAIVFLPSLAGFDERAILMAGTLALIWAVNWLHARYVPFAVLPVNLDSAEIMSSSMKLRSLPVIRRLLASRMRIQNESTC